MKQLTLNIQNKFRTRYFLNAGASARINERKLETRKIIFGYIMTDDFVTDDMIDWWYDFEMIFELIID